jgi:hypothetical protein
MYFEKDWSYNHTCLRRMLNSSFVSMNDSVKPNEVETAGMNHRHIIAEHGNAFRLQGRRLDT